MPLSLAQHRDLITQRAIARYSDDRAPLMGLSSWFPTVTTSTKAVSIEVRRNRQLVAVDVQRCTDGNRNEFNKSTEKIFVPPFYDEYYDITSCQFYDVTFGMSSIPQIAQSAAMVRESSQELLSMKWKIQRAIEKQYAEVLQTGTVTTKFGDNINYRRKAASMVVKTGTSRWSQNVTADIMGDLHTGAVFLRQEGLAVGNEVDVIMGSNAAANLMKSDAIYKERVVFSNFRRADIGMPELNKTTGLTWQGRVADAEFIYNLWAYTDFYEMPNGDKVPFIDTNNAIMIAPDFRGVTAFGGIPAVMGYGADMGVAYKEGDFLVNDVIDQQRVTWQFHVKSAPLAVPVAIDKIYTIATNGVVG